MSDKNKEAAKEIFTLADATIESIGDLTYLFEIEPKGGEIPRFTNVQLAFELGSKTSVFRQYLEEIKNKASTIINEG